MEHIILDRWIFSLVEQHLHVCRCFTATGMCPNFRSNLTFISGICALCPNFGRAGAAASVELRRDALLFLVSVSFPQSLSETFSLELFKLIGRVPSSMQFLLYMYNSHALHNDTSMA